MTNPLLASLAALTLILLSACAHVLPSTAAKTPAIKQTITNKIMDLDRAADTQCRQRKIVQSEILRFYAVTGISSERWTLDRCGQRINYLVTLKPDYYGSTSVNVQPER
ncbi:MAG TPA: hypothetical protein VML36_00735 [Nitrospiria bacterium]|nr:hypothetical protein [Nitrospiria bacterium]